MASLCMNSWKIDDIDVVLFDKDGTFVDSDIYWGKLGEMRVREIIRYFKLPDELYETLANVIGLDANTGKLITKGPLAILSRDEVIQILTDELVKNNNISTDTIEIAKIFEKVHKKFLDKMFEYTYLLKGAKEFFEKLKTANIKMAVVTSDTYSHTVETLKYLGIENYFECVVGCDSLPYPKKSGKPALFALEKMQMSGYKTIVIGDAPMDALMAKNAGINVSILVTTGQVPKDELLSYSPYVVDCLSEIEVVK